MSEEQLGKWGLKFNMEKLEDVYEDHLEADMKYFRAHLKLEAYKDLQMLEKTKAKLSDLSEKHYMLRGLQAGATGVEAVKGFELAAISMDNFIPMEFEVIRNEDSTVLKVEFDEGYFKLWQDLESRSKIRRFAFRNSLTTKKSVKKEFKNQIKDVYTKDFEMEEYEIPPEEVDKNGDE